ncbi:MAG TPA: epimerase [Cytophagales bacterium]|nr:epimerase [Cytophagales bacterium]HAA17501.1 epimerase [Cytophagales bacterium]HAP63109.1 epimerase [Cytophagales bacterium]
MKVIITGSTGMVGKGALLECLDSSAVEAVVSVTRTSVGIQHPKLTEVLLSDISQIGTEDHPWQEYDACFYCMGVSSAGMKEDAYHQITYTMTERFAETLQKANPEMTFLYVSGMGTDSTEQGRSMWARVKGKIENRLLGMGFGHAYMFRPGAIIPERGIRSRTPMYNLMLTIMRPFFPLMRRSKSVTTTSKLGQAMIQVAKQQPQDGVFEAKAINAVLN